MERDLTVYIVQEGENPEMALTLPTWTPMTVSLLCPARNGSKARTFTKKFWNDRIGSWNGNRRFFPMREIVFAIYQVSKDDPQNVRL